MLSCHYVTKHCLQSSRNALLRYSKRASNPQYKLQATLLRLGSVTCRYSATESGYSGLKQVESDKVLLRVHEPGQTLPHQQWVSKCVTMTSEATSYTSSICVQFPYPGYLSWCRNSYLCLAIAVAISMGPTFMANYGLGSLTDTGKELVYILSGAGALAMCNMVFGSMEYLYQLFKTRPLTQISWVTTLIYTVFVVTHALLFCDFARCLVGTFDGEEDEVTDIRK